MVDLKKLPIEISETNEVRSLHLETDSIQSSMLIHDPIHLTLKYTQVVALTLLFCRHPKNITILGLGAGSLTKFFFYLCPKTKINTIEINPRVIDIAHQMFEVPFETKRHHIIESDAEIYIKQNKSKLQILISDIFDGYGIPRIFTQKKYFKLCSERLENNGLFIINLWGSDKKTPNYIQDLNSFLVELLL
jgi:spermidine synthase